MPVYAAVSISILSVAVSLVLILPKYPKSKNSFTLAESH